MNFVGAFIRSRNLSDVLGFKLELNTPAVINYGTMAAVARSNILNFNALGQVE